MEKIQRMIDIAKDNGAWEAAVLPTSHLRVYAEVRDICKKNSCGGYGRTWACPPAMGTIDECLDRCRSFGSMLLFTGKYDLEDSFDYEGMIEGKKSFQALVETIAAEVRAIDKNTLIFSGGGCRRCKTCTYPEAPCRFPETLFPALEGAGFNVSELAKQAGIHYINGADTVTYFAAVFFSDSAKDT